LRSIVGGCGEILPRLFSKFVTKPETGTGLVRVVYIKNIVEAHDGRIWAENKLQKELHIVTSLQFLIFNYL
jgi:signal transduction histidine kinase